MKRLVSAVILIPVLIMNTVAWAEDAGSAEALGPSSEASSEAGGPASMESASATAQAMGEPLILLFIDPQTLGVLISTAGALFTTGYALMKWHESETRRRYADAAGEAKTRLTEKDPTPIKNATPNGSLQIVAKMEQQMLERDHPDIKLSEPQIAALVIAQHARIEAR